MTTATFLITRRGYFWCGPFLRGYCVSPRHAFRFTDEAIAERWAAELDAEVVPLPEYLR